MTKLDEMIDSISGEFCNGDGCNRDRCFLKERLRKFVNEIVKEVLPNDDEDGFSEVDKSYYAGFHDCISVAIEKANDIGILLDGKN